MKRFLEILPGFLSWLTLFLMIFISAKLPIFASIFIILFDSYWLLKTIYLYLHLRITYKLMRQNLKINWLEKIKEINKEWEKIYHLIIFPMYKEPYEVVYESFLSLEKANYPKDKFIVVLAIEERAGIEAQKTAQKIKEKFANKFFKFLITIHPQNIPGEIPGKGSNEAWAAKQVKQLIIDPLKIPYENILTSVFDIDTQIFPEYFSRLTYVFNTTKDNLLSIYQPIPLFTNNIYEANALARTISFSSTFWQMMQQSRPERLTSFSSQSIPFKALVDIGFWQTDAVSEDSRIFWQCFLHYNGNFKVTPLIYPISMDANAWPSFWKTIKHLYLQQRRWAWGVDDIPYLIYGFIKNKFIPLRKKIYWSIHIIEGFWSWTTNSILIFALGWLPVILGGKEFNSTMISYNLPKITGFIVQLSTFGVITSAILAIILLPPKPPHFKKWHYIFYVIQWLLLPITLILFGSIPALEAQTRLMIGGKFRLGFWVTPKLRIKNINPN
ncbi:MAG: glycosyltransferase family 2 protein [Patescibacteria group bacterium]|nr:glycosyltransferase family 2 protein [Patescibacteria group bacterium]